MTVSSLRTDYAAWDPRWLYHSGLTTTEDNTYGIQNVGEEDFGDLFIKDSSKVAEWKCRGIALWRLVTVPLQVVFQATGLFCYSEIARIGTSSTPEEAVRAVVQCACTIFEKMPDILLASVVGLPVALVVRTVAVFDPKQTLRIEKTLKEVANSRTSVSKQSWGELALRITRIVLECVAFALFLSAIGAIPGLALFAGATGLSLQSATWIACAVSTTLGAIATLIEGISLMKKRDISWKWVAAAVLGKGLFVFGTFGIAGVLPVVSTGRWLYLIPFAIGFMASTFARVRIDAFRD